jgi:putative chitinase
MGVRRPGPLGAHRHVADHGRVTSHVAAHAHKAHGGHGGHHVQHGQPSGPNPTGAENDSFIKDKALRTYVELRPLTGGLTADLLHQAIRGVSVKTATTWVDSLNSACKKYEVTGSLRRIAAFLGHIALESSGLRKLEEGLYYSDPKRINKYFGAIKTDEEAEAFVGHPEALANKAYANRGGNGDEASGDGWRYRGRGFIQLTLKDNYAELSRELKVDFVKNPDLVATPQYAALSAAFFWKKNGLNPLADKEMYRALGLRINSKLLGFAERESNRKRALGVLCRAVLGEMMISLTSGAVWNL